MPKPGFKPYDCVRRAWHSDRHQPIRGLLIQDIFRVVNEIHTSGTKMNKEWQEKLPIVVLKVEEIMYSKANSEAEYMDCKTLWDRANAAINTIIRRDESTETAEFLQPCIEAALHLGCTPRRVSRSQRNDTQRCYLTHNNKEHDIPTTTLKDTSHFVSDHQRLVSCHNNPCLIKETCATLKSYSVYPLYYGNHHRLENPPMDLSLRLAPPSIQIEEVSSSTYRHELEKGLSLFNLDSVDVTLDSCSSKQKLVIGDGKFCSHPKRKSFI